MTPIGAGALAATSGPAAVATDDVEEDIIVLPTRAMPAPPPRN